MDDVMRQWENYDADKDGHVTWAEFKEATFGQYNGGNGLGGMGWLGGHGLARGAWAGLGVMGWLGGHGLARGAWAG